MDLLKKLIRHFKPAKKFHPIWNTLSYAPMTGVRMFFDPTGSWQQKIVTGGYDTFLFERIRSIKPEGKTMYDIGAHVGYHTLYFATLTGERGTVVAFEPNKANFDRIEMNVRENPALAGRIRVINMAASDSAGTVTFTTNNNIESGRSTGGFLGQADTYWSKDIFRAKGFTDVTVDTITIDQMPAKLNIPAPDIMKIDVEGAEYSVLMGARETLRTKKPIIFVEVHSIAAMFDVIRFFDSVSYAAQIINKEPNGVCYLEARPKN
jgi:FkbM family methyltransferase